MKKEVFKYIRILRGNPRLRNWFTKERTEERELRSMRRMMILALGVSCKIELLRVCAALTFLAGITTHAPLFANTLAVSAPIPDVAPTSNMICHVII